MGTRLRPGTSAWRAGRAYWSVTRAAQTADFETALKIATDPLHSDVTGRTFPTNGLKLKTARPGSFLLQWFAGRRGNLVSGPRRKVSAMTRLTLNVPPVSCLLSPVSCLLSPVSCLLSPATRPGRDLPYAPVHTPCSHAGLSRCATSPVARAVPCPRTPPFPLLPSLAPVPRPPPVARTVPDRSPVARPVPWPRTPSRHWCVS